VSDMHLSNERGRHDAPEADEYLTYVQVGPDPAPNGPSTAELIAAAAPHQSVPGPGYAPVGPMQPPAPWTPQPAPTYAWPGALPVVGGPPEWQRKRSGSGVLMPLLLVLLLLGGAGGGFYWFVVKDKNSAERSTAGRNLSYPAQIAGYRLIPSDTPSTQQYTTTVQTALNNAMGVSSTVALYGRSTSTAPALVAISARLQDNAALESSLKKLGYDAVADQSAEGAMASITASTGQFSPNMQKIDPGDRGGAMRCTEVTVRGTRVGACLWVDQSFLSFLIESKSTSVPEVSTLTRQLREVAEH